MTRGSGGLLLPPTGWVAESGFCAVGWRRHEPPATTNHATAKRTILMPPLVSMAQLTILLVLLALTGCATRNTSSLAAPSTATPASSMSDVATASYSLLSTSTSRGAPTSSKISMTSPEATSTELPSGKLPSSVTVITGDSPVSIFEGSHFIAAPKDLDSKSLNAATLLARMSRENPKISTWASLASDIRLYVGTYEGNMGSLKAGNVYAYLRLANGPECTGSMIPSSEPGSSSVPMLTTQTSSCNVGVIDGLNDESSITIEGVE